MWKVLRIIKIKKALNNTIYGNLITIYGNLVTIYGKFYLRAKLKST
jgi:hypothetical protein